MSGQGREQQRVQVKKKHRSIDDLMYNLQLHQIKYIDNSTTFSYQLGLMILYRTRNNDIKGEALGTGGFAKVFKASEKRDTHSQSNTRTIALKVV